MNPNKEGCYINNIPTPQLPDGCSTILVSVPNIALDSQAVIKKIQQKVGIKIASLSKSLIWELSVYTSNQDIKQVQDDVLEHVIMTHSRDTGLLVNPILETPELLAPAHVYQ